MLGARNLEVVYDDVVLALRGGSSSVPDGQIVALLGSNGPARRPSSGPSPAHTARADLKNNLERVFSLFPVLADRRRMTAGYLSGGEQQMLAMGRAMMSNPRYLPLDEPSLGLAPLLVEQVKDVIVEINRTGTGTSSSSRTPPWPCRSRRTAT